MNDYLENKAIAEGRIAPPHFPATCPDWSEEEAINRVIKMGALTGASVYVVHLSTQLGLERIKQAQAQGQRVWTETCPQYLLLNEQAMERWGPLAKMGPPLRRADGPDREALWGGLAQGLHLQRGQRPRAPLPEGQGARVEEHLRRSRGPVHSVRRPGLETVMPLAYSEGVVKRGLPITWLARVMAENPARIFGLYPRKGVIRPGADADLLIIDPEPDGTIRVADHHGMAGWTLFEGWNLRGRPWMTLLRGRVLLNQGRLEQEPGYGRYLVRGRPVPPLGGPVR